MTYPIPTSALDDRLAIVGTAGSGKTYAAGTAVERILHRGDRTIIVDPLGVWWGLRLNQDGKTASRFDVVVFGGNHGDLPVTELSGGVIGETVATMSESCILDLSQIGTKAGERRFMLAFLTALYRKTPGNPVHVIFDEADMWCPQRLLDKEGEAAKLQGMMETIVRRGRVKGFIPWLITQRPAVLSKDVLSQADGLVAMKLTSSQDRDAIGDWVQGQADKAEWKAMWGSLAAMQRGEGIVWIPGRGVMTKASFPAKATYDSSRTPKRGEARQDAHLQPLNLASLRERLASVEAETKANDPKALKAEIDRLRRELVATSRKIDNGSEPHEIEHAEQRGFNRGRDTILRAVAGLSKDLAGSLARAEEAHAGAKRLLESFGTFMGTQADHLAKPLPAPAKSPARTTIAICDGEPMPGPQRKLLTVLAQYPKGRTKKQLAILAGYAHNGGAFNNPLANLRARGWAEGGPDQIAITAAGLTALGAFEPLPTGVELREYWFGNLDGPPAKLLRALCNVYPASLSKVELAATCGYEASGGAFNNPLARLRSLELVSGYGGAPLRASDDLF